MRRRYGCVFAVSLVVILGTVFGDFPFLFDAELKSKWYWFLITISIAGVLVLFHKRGNATSAERDDRRKGVVISIFASVAIAAFLAALYGLAQYAGLFRSGGTFKVMGNFDNPAGYASMLALSLPFVLFFTFSPKRWIKPSAWAIWGLCCAAIVLSASRTGILTALVSSACYFVIKHRSSISGLSWWKKSLPILLAVAVVAGLYFVKKDSANGRILVWQCTWDMIKEKPLFGHGYKSFEAEYMLYQARHFEQNPDSKFALLSDNVKHPFNEYLLVAAEFGIVGLAVILLFMILILRAHFGNGSKESLVLFHAAFAVCVFSCFSYPLKYPFTWIVLALCAVSIPALSGRKDVEYRGKPIPRFVKLALPLLSFAVLGLTIRDIYYENRWYRAAGAFAMTSSQTVVAEYERLHPHFENDGYFLYNYAAQLNYSGEYTQSLTVARECTAFLNDYDVQILIADNYYNLSDWDNSLEHYRLASYMCPNRFMPLYRMTLIYDVTGEDDASRKLAEKILQKEEKIPSATINRIKTMMREKLDE